MGDALRISGQIRVHGCINSSDCGSCVCRACKQAPQITRSVALLAGSKFAEPFNAIRAVQPAREKYFAYAVGQISATTRAIPARKRGVSRSSRTLGRDAVDAAAHETSVADAYGEVVWS